MFIWLSQKLDIRKLHCISEANIANKRLVPLIVNHGKTEYEDLLLLIKEQLIHKSTNDKNSECVIDSNLTTAATNTDGIKGLFGLLLLSGLSYNITQPVKYLWFCFFLQRSIDKLILTETL